jgi:hypothetical protein
LDAANADVASRVFHAHISGHSRKGHFGDISLCSIDGEAQKKFKEWLTFLNDFAVAPDFGGFISVEYEAAREERIVIESVRELLGWL